jgi:hypothetical protein
MPKLIKVSSNLNCFNFQNQIFHTIKGSVERTVEQKIGVLGTVMPYCLGNRPHFG